MLKQKDGAVAKILLTIGHVTVYAMTEEDKAWVNSAPLPSPRDYLSGASINNKIIVSGECIYDASMLHSTINII